MVDRLFRARGDGRDGPQARHGLRRSVEGARRQGVLRRRRRRRMGDRRRVPVRKRQGEAARGRGGLGEAGLGAYRGGHRRVEAREGPSALEEARGRGARGAVRPARRRQVPAAKPKHHLVRLGRAARDGRGAAVRRGRLARGAQGRERAEFVERAGEALLRGKARRRAPAHRLRAHRREHDGLGRADMVRRERARPGLLRLAGKPRGPRSLLPCRQEARKPDKPGGRGGARRLHRRIRRLRIPYREGFRGRSLARRARISHRDRRGRVPMPLADDMARGGDHRSRGGTPRGGREEYRRLIWLRPLRRRAHRAQNGRPGLARRRRRGRAPHRAMAGRARRAHRRVQRLRRPCGRRLPFSRRASERKRRGSESGRPAGPAARRHLRLARIDVDPRRRRQGLHHRGDRADLGQLGGQGRGIVLPHHGQMVGEGSGRVLEAGRPREMGNRPGRPHRDDQVVAELRPRHRPRRANRDGPDIRRGEGQEERRRSRRS